MFSEERRQEIYSIIREQKKVKMWLSWRKDSNVTWWKRSAVI